MKKNYAISPQIINTMALSNEPRGVKDSSSCFIYGNQALKSLKNFSGSFDFERLYDDELPCDGAEFAKEHIHHTQKVMKEEKSYISLLAQVYQ
ncbi:hypothetical protein [Photorhabdus stackebrandtii]|uniref:hypothetical protein n=1 Tax=Photorhabdus stackebrandtii TaxID=1123042 RepID=UPI003BB78E87